MSRLTFILLLFLQHSTAVQKYQCIRRPYLPPAIRQFHSTPLITFECDTPEQVRNLLNSNQSAEAEAVVFQHANLEHMPLWTEPLTAPHPGPLRSSPTGNRLLAYTSVAAATAEVTVVPPRRLLYLDVSHNALSSLNFSRQAPSIRRSLECLDASWNRLDTLKISDLASMNSLKSLVLKQNSLELPDEAIFRGAPELIRINLSRNPLRKLHSSWFKGLYQLQYIDLSHARIKSIARDAFLSNRLLSHLDLAENLLVAVHADALSGLESLSWLSLAGNILEEVPTKALRSLPSLELLTLDGNKFPELVESDISSMNLTSISLHRLPHLALVQATAFKNLPRLRVVQMSDNPRLRYIHPHAFSNVPQLSELYLQNNKLEHFPQELVQGREINVSLYNNPFLCDCNIKWIVNSLATPSGSFHSSEVSSSLAAFDTSVSNSTHLLNTSTRAAETTTAPATTSSAPNLTKASPVTHFIESYKYECKMVDSTNVLLLTHIPPRLLRDRCEPRLFSTWIERRITRETGSSLRLLCWGSGLPRPRIAWQLPGGRRMYVVTRRRRRRRNGGKKSRSLESTIFETENIDEEKDSIRGARITVDSGGLTLRDLRKSDSGEYRCRGRARGHQVVLRFIISIHDNSFKLTFLGSTHSTIAVAWHGHPRKLQHLYKLGIRLYAPHHETELQKVVILEPRMRSHTFAHLQPDARYEVCLQSLTSRSLTEHLHCLLVETDDAPMPAERTGIREIMRRSTVFLILGLVGSTAITICLIALFYKQLYRRYQSRKYYQRPVRSMRQELMVPLQTYNHSGSSEVIFDSRTSLITNEVKEF